MQVLKISVVSSEPVVRQEEEQEEAPPSIEEIQARAAREIERALTLKPDVAKGLEIYRTSCAECHMPEGWGLQSPLIPIPQLAGQHRTVVIKQLADIRAGNRESVVMAPYATVELIGGAQAIADVAGYIDSLEMSVDTGKGPGNDLELGAQLYKDNCARCHGPTGEGDSDAYVPRIQAQHYQYLVRQFNSIRKGKRRNANPEMVTQIRDFSARQIQAVLDYVSRLEPPEELRAPPGWRNPASRTERRSTRKRPSRWGTVRQFPKSQASPAPALHHVLRIRICAPRRPVGEAQRARPGTSRRAAGPRDPGRTPHLDRAVHHAVIGPARRS
jgi:cytochrome c553